MNNLFHSLYYEILLEAVWNSDIEDQPDIQSMPFTVSLHRMYELEYKLNALKNKPFNGNPERLDNMIKQVEKELIYTTNDVKQVLLKTLENWLKSHAILNPKTWAIARVENDQEEGQEEEFYDNMVGITTMLSEYNKYSPNRQFPERLYSYQSEIEWDKIYNKHFHYIINEMTRNINKYPAFNLFVKNVILPDEKKSRLEQLEDDPEEYLGTYGGKSSEDAENIINHLTPDDVDIGSTIFFESYKAFGNTMPKEYLIKILIEIYEKFVFPLWYGHWKAKGIDTTRKTIENIYKNLKKANESDIGNLISWTNAALNSVHQNGSMLDYVSQFTHEDGVNLWGKTWYLKDYLDGLTTGKFNEKWDKNLREVGINI